MRAHVTRMHWTDLCAGIDARSRARSQVRAYARKRGIKPARQQAPAPKRVRRKPDPERDHGGVRTLAADEIRALGYATTKPEG